MMLPNQGPVLTFNQNKSIIIPHTHVSIMTEETKLYRIEEIMTAGTSVFKGGMTREQCEQEWSLCLAKGMNPNHMRIVREQ